MMLMFLVFVLYASFVLDFLCFPIPSEASTPAMLNRAENRFSKDFLLLRLSHLGLLALWIFPLVTAVLVLTGDAMPASTPPHWLAWSGLLTAIAGRVITLLASHIVRCAVPDTMIDYSIFAYSRHPIVLGLHLTLAGLLCTTGSWLALALFPFALLYFDKKVQIEEQALLQKFPELYRHYSTTTPRYLHWPRAKRA